MSEKSHQMCACCGWSKVTTYQGLRIHQGKMGCTPKGLSVTPSQQQQYSAPSWSPPPASKDALSLHGSQRSLFQPSSTFIQESEYSRPARAEARAKPAAQSQQYYSRSAPKTAPPEAAFSTRAKVPEAKRLQSCHCGWSQVTSYQGLRIHQGRMGCTPKGLGLPQNLQHLFSSSAPKHQLHPEQPRGRRSSVDRGFETPQQQQRRQSSVEGSRTLRALDFSTRAEQEMEDKIEALTQVQIHSRKLKMRDVKTSVKNGTLSLDKEWMEIDRVFSEVIHVVEWARRKELKPLENRKKKLEDEADSLMENFKDEIEELESASSYTDVTKAFDTVLTLSESQNGSLNASFSFGSLRTTLSVMMKKMQLELDTLSVVELKRFASYAVNVKFDTSSAHLWPAASDHENKIQDAGRSQQISMAREGFKRGRSYWEVQVGGRSGWDLGVASAKANRKGKLTLSPENGYWAIVHFEGDKYAALTAPPVCVELKRTPQRVGVFLDYDEGLLSFYDVNNQTHIYSFTKCSFNDRVFPYYRFFAVKN